MNNIINIANNQLTMSSCEITELQAKQELALATSTVDFAKRIAGAEKGVQLGNFTLYQDTFETNSETRISHTTLNTGKGEGWLTKRRLDAGLLKVEAA